MVFGIASLSLIPARSGPGHAFEQVTQLLFGELYTVQEKKDRWLKILTEADAYSCWIHAGQHNEIAENLYREMQNAPKAVAAEVVQTVTGMERSFPLLIGSILYDFDGMNFRNGREKYVYSGQAVMNNQEMLNGEHIRKFAMKFLHAPYQWGGRSPFGIDCSGLSQVVFKVYGMQIPRDSPQQATCGRTVHFLHESREGDLAFFEDQEGKIHHVGIILQNQQIIHAAGKVRIDTLDHHGIFNQETHQYSHTLRIIKRLL